MFLKSLRLFFNFLLLLVVIACMIWHELVLYGLEQGYGQLRMVRDSKPIAEILADPSANPDTKRKLELVGEIKQFAFDSLGINRSENYSDFYDQGTVPTLVTISACEPYSFKPKEWTFPFLGTVSYKGFFNLKNAWRETFELKMQGYDVDVYSPSGWSTLGWFRDPVLSKMLEQPEGDLSNLLIHELTHGTLYVKNNVTFNENLASFIGDKGAERFLIYKYGMNSKEYIQYEESKEDEDKYNKYILKSAERLDSLYSLMGKGKSEEQTKSEKQKLIREIAMGVYRLVLHRPKTYFNYTLQAFREGNAFFMAFNRYDSQYALFDEEYKGKFHSDLKAYLDYLKGKYPSL